MSDAPRPKATVYVGGLTSAVDSHTLHNAFIPFGPIVNISLPKPELPSNPDPHRGFGYVEFENTQYAHESNEKKDKTELFGRVIKVNLAKEQKAEGEGLGSKTAIWEQVSILPVLFLAYDTNHCCRKVILQHMQSVMRIVWLHEETRMARQIPCKVWKVLMLLGLGKLKSLCVSCSVYSEAFGLCD